MHVMVIMHLVLNSRAACIFFFFNDTATTEIYTLSLHDALPICRVLMSSSPGSSSSAPMPSAFIHSTSDVQSQDRKSTRLNSSHLVISYAVFCLKKKKRKFPDSNVSALPPGPSPLAYTPPPLPVL